jgi:predicted O-methyltransferase YrrM
MLKTVEIGLRNLVRPRLMSLALRRLRKETSGFKTMEEAINRAYTIRFWDLQFRPMQVRTEITAFLKKLEQKPPSTMLEIGTEKGGTFFLLARAAAPDALILSLDLPATAPSAYPAWREELYRNFARERQRIEIVRADSHAPATLEKVLSLLGNRKLDLLFIDGDHSYDGVKKDFEMYSTFMAPEGIIAFHDIVDGPESYVGGVPKFWRELKLIRPHFEIVNDWKQGGWGIGVLPPAKGI